MSIISFYVPILQQKNSYRVSGREVSDDAVLRWGYGTEYSLDGGHVIYSGQWEDGLRHGFGTEYQDTPRVYYKVDIIQDFLYELAMKPHTCLMEIIILSLL